MSHAWEMTDEDIEHAARELGLVADAAEWEDNVNPDLVEAAVLAYTDFDEQCEAAHQEIMRQLKSYCNTNGISL